MNKQDIYSLRSLVLNTLLRFEIFNLKFFFPRHSAVFYLECDCGQTEFTPPGILSLVKITNPLLGPSFTHSVDLEKYVFSAGIYLLKFNKGNGRTICEICTKLAIKKSTTSTMPLLSLYC